MVYSTFEQAENPVLEPMKGIYMKWKSAILAASLALAMPWGIGAYDLESLAVKTLPQGFVYKKIEAQQTIPFWGQDVSYQMGQLQVTLSKSQRFSSGYIIETQLPESMEKGMRPFFQLNRDEKVWRLLTRINRALMNEESPLRQHIAETMKSLAVNAMGPMAETGVTVEISQVEPMRRLSAEDAYVYTAGGLITYNAEGLVLPMYCRTYFFPGEGGLKVMMLFTPDEGKDPLVYAINDLAQAAAKEEILGKEGYKDLGELIKQ